MNVNFTITTSKRKTISICVTPVGEVRVSAPKWLSRKKIDEFVLSKQQWIDKKIEHFRANPPRQTQPYEYLENSVLYFLGVEYKLRILEGGKNDVVVGEDVIHITQKPNTKTEAIWLKWLKKQAEIILSERLKLNFIIFSHKLKYPMPQLKLRRMKRRWGSMSNKGIMTLNINLIHATLECIDYVIMHELCHLKHQNHSKKFYDLQEQFTPNWKEIKKKLNREFSLN